MRHFSAALWFCIPATLIPGPLLGQIALYCVEEITAGVLTKGANFAPQTSEGPDGKRYTVILNDDLSEAVGVSGTKTPYRCVHGYPNKAPDMLTCTNTLLASMSFHFSLESYRFILSQVTPGAWLSTETDRQRDDVLASDLLVFGRCEIF